MSQQLDFHFRITGSLNMNGQTVHLHEENFINLIRVSKYWEKLTPMILVRLQIDRKLMDYIIKNSSDILIRLKITKFARNMITSEDGPEVTYINEDYLVVTDDDVNYNEALNYIEENVNDIKIEDKFKETYIGLVSKLCLDVNKFVANEVIYASYMQDIVMTYLSGLHLLIEPLDNNQYFESLIIPPMDTISSILEYLNSVSVFYDSTYTFFIDEPRTTFLVARGLTGTKSKGEKYNDVIFAMRGPEDNNHMAIGMIYNDDLGCYWIDIPTNTGSKYKVDDVTVRKVSSIDIVINPTFNKSLVMGAGFQEYKQMVKNTISTFLGGIKDRVQNIRNIGEKLSQVPHQMSHAVQQIKEQSMDIFNRTRTNLTTIIKNLPSTIKKDIQDAATGMTQNIEIRVITEEQRSIEMTTLNQNYNSAETNINRQTNVDIGFGRSMASTSGTYYSCDFLDNQVRAVSYANFQDIFRGTTQSINDLGTQTRNCRQQMEDTVNSERACFNNYTNDIGNMINQSSSWLSNINNAIQALQGDSGSGSSNGGNGGPSANDATLNQLQEYAKLLEQEIAYMSETQGVSEEYGGWADGAIEEGNRDQDNLSEFTSTFEGYQDMISNAGNVDIQSMIKSETPPIIYGRGNMTDAQSNILSAAQKQSKKGGGLSSLNLNNLGSALSGQEINFSDLTNLKKNIQRVDLGSFGSIGLTNANFDVYSNKKRKGGTGTKLIKAKNDNPNALKNIKSDMELNLNRLHINKIGLDPSVFTPNKKYAIMNYDAHNNKDGRFTLREKVEMFVREDQTFICNTQLTFSKLVDSDEINGSQDAVDISTPNPTST